MQDYIPRKMDINGNIEPIVVKQYDNLSRYIHLQLFDEDASEDFSEDGELIPMNLVGCEARLYVELTDGSPTYTDGEVADGEEGIATFLLPGGMTQTAGDYRAEAVIINPETGSVISTNFFTIKVKESLHDDSSIEATEKFSALENALIRIAVDKTRLNNLEAMVDTGHILPGTVDSEVVDIRTGYNGNTYDSAGNAVRAQITDLQNSLSAVSTLVDALIEGETLEASGNLISELQEVLENAQSFQYQINQIGRRIDNIGDQLPLIGVNKLTPALRVPSSSLSFGTIAEMLKCAETYFNFAYGTDNGEYGALLYKTGVGMYSESLGNGTKIKGANEQEIDDATAEEKYGIVCSSFVEAVINGITCENSRYKGKDKNTQQPWGVVFDDTVSFGRTENPSTTEVANRYLTSHALAKYADEHGWLYPIDSAHKVKPGDVVFYGKSTDQNRFHGIEHVAIAINVSDDYLTVIEAWNDAAEQTHSKVNMSGTTRYCGVRIKRWAFEEKSGEGDNAVVNKIWTYGATFPVGGVYNAPMLCYHSRDISGTTDANIAANVFTSIYSSGPLEPGFYTFVCRGTFPSKKSDATGKTFPNAKVIVTYDEGHPQEYLLQAGNVYYETFYVQQAGSASIAIQGANQPYHLSDIALYKGYADVSTFSVVSKDSVGIELFADNDQNTTKANDDLNNCFEGVYYCNNAITAQYVGHTPLGNSPDVTSGFRMESVRLCRNNRFMQTLTYIEHPEKVYARQYSAISGTEQWGSWYCYEGQIVT